MDKLTTDSYLDSIDRAESPAEMFAISHNLVILLKDECYRLSDENKTLKLINKK